MAKHKSDILHNNTYCFLQRIAPWSHLPDYLSGRGRQFIVIGEVVTLQRKINSSIEYVQVHRPHIVGFLWVQRVTYSMYDSETMGLLGKIGHRRYSNDNTFHIPMYYYRIVAVWPLSSR